jgi:hypothetical protein
MAGVEVTADELCRRLSPKHRAQVHADVAAGKGVAMYVDDRGRDIVAMTFGTKDSDLAGLPPARYGGGELSEFVSPLRTAASLRSPLMDYEPPIQIHRPRVSPSVTEYPEVLISGRTGPRPRGDGEFINARRGLLPGREQQLEEVLPQPELSESDSWWARRLQ